MLGFILKIGVIAYTIDWLHSRFHDRREHPSQQRTLTMGETIDEGLTRTKEHIDDWTPRLRSWFNETSSGWGHQYQDGEKEDPCRRWRRRHHQQRADTTVTTLPDGRVGVEIDVPGVKKDELVVSVVEGPRGYVVVKGESKGDENRGRRGRSVERRVEMPRMSDLGDVKATCEDGVLRVEVGKKDFEGRRIPVA
ncbi:hypothetical protein HK101_004249 [Irineochytrium annulatum]|nr:hypothetical protein HK101_004249 [Irineochytrium annulatum]